MPALRFDVRRLRATSASKAFSRRRKCATEEAETEAELEIVPELAAAAAAAAAGSNAGVVVARGEEDEETGKEGGA